MFRALPTALLVALLAGCSSVPADRAVTPDKAEVAKPNGGCAQSDWQAQTAPVISKRQGNEALEKYNSEEPGNGCH
jgi:hypothetical protein